ncbi:MAG: AAA family ATPase [Deltaproteobacteria bacterium]|nr:AAA family ATPase [Deltaproteobacteria bacterium]
MIAPANGHALKIAPIVAAPANELDRLRSTLEDLEQLERQAADDVARLRADRDGLTRRAREIDPDFGRLDPENDGRETTPDPAVVLEQLRGSGALVGYDALTEATAVPPVSIWYSGVERDSHIEVAGPSGHGKTTFALMFTLARASCTGSPVMLLGRPVTPGQPGQYVVVIEEENGKYSLRRKAEIACEMLDLPVRETLDRVIFLVRQRVTVSDPRWSAIEQLGRAGKVSAVLIDSRARVLRRGEANGEDDQAAISNLVHTMVEACGAPVIVISHTRKGERGSGPSEIEDVSGSLQRAAGADVVLLVTARKSATGRVEACTLKFAKLRDALEDHPAPVTFGIGKNAEGRWCVSADYIEPVDDRPIADRLVDLLGEHPDGLTKTKIRDVLKVRTDVLETALTGLFSDRRITRKQSVIGGRPRNLFSLREVP